MIRESKTLQGAHIITVAGMLYLVPFSDLDFRREFADCDACGSKRVEEREKAEGIGEVEDLHGCRPVRMFEKLLVSDGALGELCKMVQEI